MGKLMSGIMFIGLSAMGVGLYKTYQEVEDLRAAVNRECWFDAEDRMKRFSEQILKEIQQMFGDARYAEDVSSEEAVGEEDDDEPLQPDEIYRYVLSRFHEIVKEEEDKETPDAKLISLMNDQIKLIEEAHEAYQDAIVNDTLENAKAASV